MEISYHTASRSLGISYTDERYHPTQLTEQEQDYFRETVAKVLRATGLTFPVYTSDHEQLPGDNYNALGIHWRSLAGSDEFITVDNYFIHEAYQVAFCGGYDLNDGETLVSVLCHELAHIRYQRHTKYHAALTAQLIGMVEAAA